ncbi:hypothetical protein N7478_011773 [Penicillium angulare]|uniref:uncharacterized protein n=1 Tax=Penicillium angulare TaxID=116970 RepID=UPI0025406082|nr:uncharacterized protein N7478_011773 [Penicillium angulare]KAJ5261178.1 hypothetical protein N7478_011773 [Penicillium angulare]
MLYLNFNSTSEVTTSNIKGLAFDRFYQVWLENINYDDAVSDANMQWLSSEGILLTNLYVVTHPSEPNYCAAAGRDTFGKDNSDFNQVPRNVSTIADLLDPKSVSYNNTQVRKYNQLVIYESAVSKSSRARHIKTFDDFENDLKDNELPWWAFITPNMTNDAHDTSITFVAKWERPWLAKLLENEYFYNDTPLLLTFDEDNIYINDNHIFSVLVGGAVPQQLKGTKDNTFYTHDSTIASIVAKKSGYANYEVNKTYLAFNQTYPGPLSVGDTTVSNTSTFITEWPVPITDSNEKCSAGHGILDVVKKTYGHLNTTYDTKPYPRSAKTHYDDNVTAKRSNKTTSSKTNSTTVSSSHDSAEVSATDPITPVVLEALLAIAVYTF